jgi:serine/threonine-protein kinase
MVYFGHFRLDLGEQVLYCAEKRVQLTPKAFEVLRILMENKGHVVEKKELMQTVWPDAIVEDANLAQTIFVLRKILGETHRGHRHQAYIETVARRGYRFIATVSVYDEVGAMGPKESEQASERNREKEARASMYTESAEAYHLYLRGRYYWGKYTIEGLNKAIKYFRQAIKLYPDHALSYAGLADCYYRLSNILLAPRKAVPKAKAALTVALKINDTLGEAHALLALIRLFYDRDWPAAENEFERAIELAPDSAFPCKRYGWALGMLGRFDEAIPKINRALHLEPRSAEVLVGLGIVLHLARRHDAAIAQAHLALDMEPDFFAAHVLLGIAQLQQSRLTEAVAALQKAASLASIPWTLGYLGYAYGVSGKPRQALKILTGLEKRSEQAYLSPYALALIHTGLGHKEQALQSLVKTFEDRNEMFGFVKASPEFDDLRSEEGFEALLQRSKLTATAP